MNMNANAFPKPARPAPRAPAGRSPGVGAPHPVLLFDVGVVVLVVGARAGEGHGSFAFVEIAEQMVVEEFAAVVAVKSSFRIG